MNNRSTGLKCIKRWMERESKKLVSVIFTSTPDQLEPFISRITRYFVQRNKP